MKAKLLHHSEEWLPYDLEAPPSAAKEPFLSVWRVQHSPFAPRLALKLSDGVGIWEKSGALVKFFPKAADFTWTQDPARAYLWMPVFAPCAQGAGVRHALLEVDTGSFATQPLVDLCVETGGPRYLELSTDNTLGIATWLDQTEWGYVSFDPQQKSQRAPKLSWGSPTLSPPAFAPSRHAVVSCHFGRAAWWNDYEGEDPSEVPSPGGRRRIGVISVHDLDTNQITHSEVMVDLPAGWIPDRPYYSEWYQIWGPVFQSPTSFLIWLPDGTTELLSLPLPTTVVLGRPLLSEREWPEDSH
jgi:hypothetical protein